MLDTANYASHDILSDLIDKARKAGADAADALLVDTADLSVSVRLGDIENLERSESGDLGLRVFIGNQQAIVSATDRSSKTLAELVTRAVAMARLAPKDEFCGLASSDEIAKQFPTLEMADTVDYSTEQLITYAKEAEDAARAVKGVTNSLGADASCGSSRVTIVASNGFAGSYHRTHYNFSASVLAGEGTGMQRDYDYAQRVFASDMPTPSSIGTSAGERAVKRLNPRKMATARVPVIFDPRISGSLLGTLIGSINGASIARGTSFLKEKLGQKIFRDDITVIDDPHRPRGLRSRAFDAEGLLPCKRKVIEAGILTTWLLDLRSARQLKMKSTGHASRSTGSTPSPSAHNVYMQAGKLSPISLMSDIEEGFYVSETMGMGINGVTGDYSQAASGFWIEKGVISFPVSEMTIAGNLKDMFLNLTPANDLQFLRGMDAPTLRVEGMTVAGM